MKRRIVAVFELMHAFACLQGSFLLHLCWRWGEWLLNGLGMQRLPPRPPGCGGHVVCLESDDKSHCVVIQPWVDDLRQSWQRLGAACVLHGAREPCQQVTGLTSAELEAIEALVAPGSNQHGPHAWPFDTSAEPLLAAAEEMARRFLVVVGVGDADRAWEHSGGEGRRLFSDSPTPCDEWDCHSYQYAFRDTCGHFGPLATVHSDNVFAEDTMRDFAPTLHKAREDERTASGLAERLRDSNAPRDLALAAVTRRQKRMVMGLNVWILLEDRDADFPLAFAELGPHYEVRI